MVYFEVSMTCSEIYTQRLGLLKTLLLPSVASSGRLGPQPLTSFTCFAFFIEKLLMEFFEPHRLQVFRIIRLLRKVHLFISLPL